MIRVLLKASMILATPLSLAAATYHVDGIAGDDARSGMAPEQAWRSLDRVNREVFKPGDRILFKAGSRFTGQLRPQGSGAVVDGKPLPITIDRYGTGDRPRLDGEGVVLDTVLLRNLHYWEVRGLEITNQGSKPRPWQSGVRLEAEGVSPLRHLHLLDLYIHDVTGDMRKSHEGCGISIVSKGKAASFDGVRVEGCRLVRTDRNGICQRSDGGPRTRNLVIRKNLLEDIGGDGIKPWGSDGALVEWNVIRGARGRYNGGTKEHGASAGIWPWDCDDTVIQFNEVSGYKGTLDGQGFDSDYRCRRSLFQYNYSHDNDGGFLLVCSPGDSYCEDTVVRFNVSRNDGIDSARVFHFGGGSKRTSVYNNTIHVTARQDVPLIKCDEWDRGIPEDVVFTNNLFLVEGRVTYDLAKGRRFIFLNNAFIGRHEKPPADAQGVTLAPPFVSPSTVGDGFPSLAGYGLRPGATWPRGVVIPDHGGRDVLGAVVPVGLQPPIGAVQYR